MQHKTEAGCVFRRGKAGEEKYAQILENAKAYVKADAAIDGVLIQEMAGEGPEVIVDEEGSPGPVILQEGWHLRRVFKILPRLLPG
ncbi:MAG: hypothetical protein ACLVJO_11305 [[Clostridium] scindens]